MNRSPELQCLDFACNMTKNKNIGFCNVEYMKEAIESLIKGHANGFTRDQGARGYVENLSKDNIDKELLLNIVKVQALKNFNHEATLLGINKTFNDNLTVDELELLTFKLIEMYDIDSIRNLFDQFPDKYDTLVLSFVFRRYFDSLHNADSLDDQQIMTWEYASKQGKIESAFGTPKTY